VGAVIEHYHVVSHAGHLPAHREESRLGVENSVEDHDRSARRLVRFSIVAAVRATLNDPHVEFRSVCGGNSVMRRYPALFDEFIGASNPPEGDFAFGRVVLDHAARVEVDAAPAGYGQDHRGYRIRERFDLPAHGCLPALRAFELLLEVLNCQFECRRAPVRAGRGFFDIGGLREQRFHFVAAERLSGLYGGFACHYLQHVLD